MSDEAQFDALLGGTEELPSSLSLAKFVACRSQEIQIMKNSLVSQCGTKLAFQSLPKHMRRRAMSHNVKRLPRRLRQIHLNQMKKSGMPAKQKRPSRKYRRRPRNLLEEYTRRANKRYRWLQTHIWHAKRFHMVERWGYKLPNYPCDKAFRACYRALTQHCLMQDISYFNCVEISGDENLIIDKFKVLCKNEGGLSIGAKAFVQGNREGEITLYENVGTDFRKAIGLVKFQWQPNSKNDVSKLWLWVHTAFYNNVKSVLQKCFENCPDIVVQELKEELCRFRLTGPLSNAVLHDSLVIHKFDTALLNPHFEDYLKSGENDQFLDSQNEFWEKISSLTSLHEISPHIIHSLLVRDPRLTLPQKRTKSEPELKQFTGHNDLCNVPESPLWDKSIRKSTNENKLSDAQIADLQNKLLVPGSDLKENDAVIPIILIQRPGNKTENIGLGSGWDVILPSAWAKPFWVAFVMRGARVGGLREFSSILFEMGKSQFLRPDSEAGMAEERRETKENVDKFFRRPPNKRINYNKFKIASPLSYNWKVLIKDWSQGSDEEFIVINDKRILNSIDLFLKSKSQFVPEIPKNALLPVKLECEKRGSPSQYAIICLPKSKNDLRQLVVEPPCEDKYQDKRKEMRQAHQSLLKKLRKRRKTKPECHIAETDAESLITYREKMRALWLPEPTTIRDSCSREVIGFVTKGGFSFAIGKSAGTGYITSESLKKLSDVRNKILFRNTNSRQYRVAKLSVILD